MSNTMNMTVENTGFLVDRLGEDCEPLQWVRELTQNSIEAIERLPNGEAGEIVWDVDEFVETLTGIRKLCIIDNGVGMTGDEQLKYINRLSSSSALQALDQNFGIGAKIAGVTKHPAGLLYMSWQDNEGTLLHLWKDPESGAYGTKYQGEGDSGTAQYIVSLSDDVKPSYIKEHGTKVVLMGRVDEEDTVEPPPAVRAPSKWLRRYLNTRYYQLSDRVRIRVREGWNLEKSNQNYTLREVKGQKSFLDDKCEHKGLVHLDGASAHWWILREGEDLTQNFAFFASSGHVAALYQKELYELIDGPAGAAMLHRFGVNFGYERVVLYLEPDPSSEGISSNTARTRLLINSQPLPWSEWAREFRQNMPEELEAMMADLIQSSQAKSNQEAIRERLKKLRDMFKFSRYRPSDLGDTTIGQSTAGGSIRENSGQTRSGSSKPGGKGGSIGDLYALFKKQGQDKGVPILSEDIPEVMWVSRKDGTRAEGFMEDRAAHYTKEGHQIQANADFRGFTDMVERYQKFYEDTPNAGPAVEQIVREWFEQALVEAVLGLLALKDSPQWNPDHVEAAINEEALTTAVMPRTFIDFFIKRALGTKLGKIPEAKT